MRRKGFKLLITLCVFFATQAVLFAQIPAGYYYAAHSKKKAALKTALHELAYPRKVLKYGSGEGATWEGFFHTDQHADGSVIDMYSTVVRYFNGYSGVSGMHIEHSLPKSWWGGTNNYAYRDLFHLYPSDGVTNSTKNNYPLGKVSSSPILDNGVSKIGTNIYGAYYTGYCFEPADEYKGDFARSYFYISTIYEDFSDLWDSPMMDKNTYPVWKAWAIDLLMEWNEQDPVSAKELSRQEEVCRIQGNRNPFIDYPDLADYIWGADTLRAYPFPGSVSAYLVSPLRGTSLDYGVILEGDAVSKQITVTGIDIVSDLSLSMKGTNGVFYSSAQTVSRQNALDGYFVDIYFNPSCSGVFADTLVISGGGLDEDFFIPLHGQAAGELMVFEPDERTPVGGTLKWIADPQASDYRLTVAQGASRAGDLLISAYVEGSGFNKAIELYNGTGSPVDLSDYMLMKQSNGYGPFEASYRLSGSLADGSTYLIVNKMAATDSPLKQMFQAMTDSVLNFNGNDAVALYHNGVMIDVVGYADAGETVVWGLDHTMTRRPEVTHPTLVFDPSQWIIDPQDDFDRLGNHAIDLVNENIILDHISTGGNPYYEISGLMPESLYTFEVESVHGSSAVKSVNTAQLKTTALEAPVVMDAVDVGTDHFVADWEADPYVDTYLLNVFRLTGSTDIAENEYFDGVGANGKPLPDGWSGTASGSYTSTSSSGTNPPSVALKNTGEYVQTKVYPYPVKNFRFMYKYASSSPDSYFKVEALKTSASSAPGNALAAAEAWEMIDSIPYAASTSRYYPEYHFDQEDGVRSLRVVYAQKAGSGNIALDDFTIIYGSLSEEYVLQDGPVTGNEKRISGLVPGTDYYYNVRTVKGDSRSEYSETVMVSTPVTTAIPSGNKPNFVLRQTGGEVILSGLSGHPVIRLFNLQGMPVFYLPEADEQVVIPLKTQGVYILNIQGTEGTVSVKLIR